MAPARRPAPELMQAALIDLLIAAAPFRAGRGMTTPREALARAIARARKALDAARAEDVGVDWKTLQDLAREADAEARAQPGYRADLEG